MEEIRATLVAISAVSEFRSCLVDWSSVLYIEILSDTGTSLMKTKTDVLIIEKNIERKTM